MMKMILTKSNIDILAHAEGRLLRGIYHDRFNRNLNLIIAAVGI